MFGLLFAVVMVAVAGFAVLVGHRKATWFDRTCRRAAWAGGLSGAALGAIGGALLFVTLFQFSTMEMGAALILMGVGGLTGAPAGAAAGAWFWVGAVQLAKGPRERWAGALLGLAGGAAAGVPLLLAVPQWYFERAGAIIMVGLPLLVGLGGAMVGAVAGDAYHKAAGAARKRMLVGGLTCVAVLAVGAALSLGSVGGHTTNVREMAARDDVEGLIRKLETGGQQPYQRRVMQAGVDVRVEAARALGQSGDRRAVPALIAVMATTNGSDYGLRCAAAEALGNLGDKEAVPALIDALKRTGINGQGPEVVTIILALGKLRDRQAVPILLERFHSFKDVTHTNVTEVPEAAGQALARIGGPEIVPAVVERLSDPDPEMRQVATRTLGRLAQAGQPGAMAALMQCLKNPEWTVRFNAAEALKAGGAEAVPALIEALKDQMAGVRKAAVESLGKIGDARAKDALQAAAKDESEWVRLAATQALKKNGW
jgi:HEAT repeat protein